LIETVLQRGKTVVLTTHYMEEAQRLCDEIIIVDKGHIIASGEPNVLVRTHLPAVIARLPANAWPADLPLPDNSELRNGFIEISADEEHVLLDQLESSGANLGDLKIEAPNLEDLFLKLTGHALRN
jgi:ABC-2 type transport system ATP-binding protein